MTNLALLLDDAARDFPERLAAVDGDDRRTYGELDADARRIADLLRGSGVRPGDKVAMSCLNTPDFTSVYFGILKAGATVVPLNVLLKAREIAYHLSDSQAVAYFAHEGTADLPVGEAASAAARRCDVRLFMIPDDRHGAPWAQANPGFQTVDADDDDTAVVLYTSGTTGQPKGAELRHRNLRDNALVSSDVYEVRRDRPETYLCALPLFHAFGQTCIQNGAVANGGTTVMMRRYEPAAALRLMTAHGVTIFAGVPTMYWGLLEAVGEVDDRRAVAALSRTLRVAASGGAALPIAMHRRFEELFGVVIQEGYGLSETSPAASFARSGEELRVGSIGRPVPGVEMRLINDDWSDVPADPEAVGEIAIRGHNVMKGYHNRPEATAMVLQDGWFRSGDLAKKDRDGFYYIVDRAKDLIIRGGFNVYPREVEEALMAHPAVSLVAVIGVTDHAYGEEIKAVVVKHKDNATTEAELLAWSRDQLAAYKYPRIVEFAESLPMSATGKILKREIA